MDAQPTSVTHDEAIAAIAAALEKICPECEVVVADDRSSVWVTQRAGYFRFVVDRISAGSRYSISVSRHISQNRDQNWVLDFSVDGTFGGAGMGLMVYNFEGDTVAAKYESALRRGFDFMTRIKF